MAGSNTVPRLGRAGAKSKKLTPADEYTEALARKTFEIPPRMPGQKYGEIEREIALQALVLCGGNYSRASKATKVGKDSIRTWWDALGPDEQEATRHRVSAEVLGDIKIARAMALDLLIHRMDKASVFELTGIVKTMNEQAASLEGRATSRVEHVLIDARQVLGSRLQAIQTPVEAHSVPAGGTQSGR